MSTEYTPRRAPQPEIPDDESRHNRSSADQSTDDCDAADRSSGAGSSVSGDEVFDELHAETERAEEHSSPVSRGCGMGAQASLQPDEPSLSPRSLTNQETARAYAQFRFAVVPNHAVAGGVCSCFKGKDCRSPGKHPSTRHGVKDATTDPDAIRKWWLESPGAGVGIATGRISSLLVIDIDLGPGGDKTLKQLEADHGGLPATVTSRTGSGGQHYYFRRPDIDEDIVSAAHGLGTGVDLRVEGAQVIAPPTIHHSGSRYEWEPGKAPGEVPLAELPQTWRKLLKKRSAGTNKARTPHPVKSPPGPVAQPLTKDDRQLVFKMRSAPNGDKFNALWRGERWEFPSLSEADASFCAILAFWTAKNAEQMDRLFRCSGRMRDKWDEVHHGDNRTYGEVTIERAIETCDDVYQGRPSNFGGRGTSAFGSATADSADARLDLLVRAGKSRDECWGELGHTGVVPAGCREHFDSLWFAADAERRFDQSPPPGQFARKTDLGNAERLVAVFGRLIRHVAKRKKWLVWTGRRWRIDDTNQMMRIARRAARLIYKEAMRATDSAERKALASFAAKSESERALKAMVQLACSDAAVAIRVADLDRDPWLLNCTNGTVDLRTGELRAHCAGDMLTKIASTAFDPDSTCPRWVKFLDEVFKEDQETIEFIQRYLGMTLTGDVSEQILTIFNGPGSNGKSVLVDTVVGLLGDYATIAAPDLLVSSTNDRHPTEIADLAGRRLVVASETDEGRRMRIAFVKAATGDGQMKARLMREDFWSFKREFKLILSTNHLPRVREESHAIWRRVKVVPFNVIIADDKQDKELLKTLQGEWPGILAWAMRGCLDWQKGGLRYSPAVIGTTQAYRQQEDLIEQFLMDCCTLGSAHSCAVTRKAIRKAYQQWARDVDEKATLSRNAFYDRLRNRSGIEEYRTSGRRGFTGVCLARLADFLKHDECIAEGEFVRAVVVAKTPSAGDLVQQFADAGASPAASAGSDASVENNGATPPAGGPPEGAPPA